MDKKRIQIIITAALIVILIIAWARAIITIKKKLQKDASYSVVTSSVNALRPSPEDRQQHAPQPKGAPLVIDEEVGWKRCPFSGLMLLEEAGVSDLRLNGIIWDDVNPQALINNEPYMIGDSVGKYIIVNISKQKVMVSDGEKEFELYLY